MGKHRVFNDENGLPLERFWAITHPHRRKPEKYSHRYRKDAPKLRALVVVHCGIIQELCHIGEGLEWLIDESGEDMNDYLEDDGGKNLPNGVYIWEGEIKDTGGYDSEYGIWESDCYLEGEYRPATKEEWEYHVKGDYPWDPALWFDYAIQDPDPTSKEEEFSFFNPDLKF